MKIARRKKRKINPQHEKIARLIFPSERWRPDILRRKLKMDVISTNPIPCWIAEWRLAIVQYLFYIYSLVFSSCINELDIELLRKFCSGNKISNLFYKITLPVKLNHIVVLKTLPLSLQYKRQTFNQKYMYRISILSHRVFHKKILNKNSKLFFALLPVRASGKYSPMPNPDKLRNAKYSPEGLVKKKYKKIHIKNRPSLANCDFIASRRTSGIADPSHKRRANISRKRLFLTRECFTAKGFFLLFHFIFQTFFERLE